MAPKKNPVRPNTDRGPTETEKEFFLLEIAALNKKLARYYNTVQTYEHENLQLQEAIQKLDQDRTDVITFLKKTLAAKNDEVSDLKDKVRGLEETREMETREFKGRIAELEKNFNIMKEQLSAENKLLAGKLNTLEEFRAIRDDLMKKFEKQDQDFIDQEMKYKRLVYDAEKKLIIGKDQLQKDMEKRLLKLAEDYEDASELRIAASTHRILRENIAVNRELDAILQSQEKLRNLVVKCENQEKKAIIEKELAEEERDTAILKSVTQLKVIEQLTASILAMKKEYATNKRIEMDVEEYNMKIKYLQDKNEFLSTRIAILEQELHRKENTEFDSKVNSQKIKLENQKLKHIIREAMITLEAVLKINLLSTEDLQQKIMNKNLLLQKLAEILAQYQLPFRADSGTTLINFSAVYKQGLLGIIPSKRSIKMQPTTPRAQFVKRESAPVPEVEIAEMEEISVPSIPSTHLVPYKEAVAEEEIESIPSFTRSQGSEQSEDVTSEIIGDEEDMEAQLTKSKLALQKSALKDLQDLPLSKSELHGSSRVAIEGSDSKSIMDKDGEQKVKSEPILKESTVSGEGAAAEVKPHEADVDEQEAT